MACNTQSYSENASDHRNLSWFVQYGAYQSAVQLAGITLVVRLGPEVGDAAALVIGVKVQVQADGVVDAADETHAGVGLFFHGRSSLCVSHYSIDAGFGQTPPLLSPFGRGPAAQFVTLVERTADRRVPPLLVSPAGCGRPRRRRRRSLRGCLLGLDKKRLALHNMGVFGSTQQIRLAP